MDPALPVPCLDPSCLQCLEWTSDFFVAIRVTRNHVDASGEKSTVGMVLLFRKQTSWINDLASDFWRHITRAGGADAVVTRGPSSL